MPSKENIQHLQNIKFLFFFLLLWVIFALLDPDPDSESGSETLDILRYRTWWRRSPIGITPAGAGGTPRSKPSATSEGRS